MTREERARQQERISRRERIRRKKGRRLRRKIRNACCLTILTAVLCVASGLLISCLKWTGVLPNSPSYEIEPPVIRTEKEVKERIEELAKKDRGFKEILKNYDEYPEVYLAALANNPEMLDYVKGYLKHEKLDAALTKKDTSATFRISLLCSRPPRKSTLPRSPHPGRIRDPARLCWENLWDFSLSGPGNGDDRKNTGGYSSWDCS